GYWKDVAGGILQPVLLAGVHQRGRVRQKLQPRHHEVVLFAQSSQRLLALVRLASAGNVLGHPPEPAARRLEHARAVALQVALLEHDFRVRSQARIRQTLWLTRASPVLALLFDCFVDRHARLPYSEIPRPTRPKSAHVSARTGSCYLRREHLWSGYRPEFADHNIWGLASSVPQDVGRVNGVAPQIWGEFSCCATRLERYERGGTAPVRAAYETGTRPSTCL